MSGWNNEEQPLPTRDRAVDKLVQAVFITAAIVAVIGLIVLGMSQTQDAALRAGDRGYSSDDEATVPIDLGVAPE